MNHKQQQHTSRQVAGRIAWTILKTVGRSMLICLLVTGAIFSTLRKEA